MNETKWSADHRTVKLLEEIEFLKKQIANRDADIAELENELESAYEIICERVD